MIEINKQVILANKQIITFNEYTLRVDMEGKLESRIVFMIKSESGQLIRPIAIHLNGEEHNEFWKNFNDGSYLYKILAQREGVEFTASEEVENSFLNK